jgi:hypothetical protein
MVAQVTLTRTDTGANVKVRWDPAEENKDYPSWDQALEEAEQLGLITAAEALAAKLLPPGFPFHANGGIDPSSLTAHNFVSGKHRHHDDFGGGAIVCYSGSTGFSLSSFFSLSSSWTAGITRRPSVSRFPCSSAAFLSDSLLIVAP